MISGSVWPGLGSINSASAPAKLSNGRFRGEKRAVSQKSPLPRSCFLRSEGITPAFTIDDLPLPDPPMTTAKELRSKRWRISLIWRSRPKKRRCSLSSNGRSPG